MWTIWGTMPNIGQDLKRNCRGKRSGMRLKRREGSPIVVCDKIKTRMWGGMWMIKTTCCTVPDTFHNFEIEIHILDLSTLCGLFSFVKNLHLFKIRREKLENYYNISKTN